MTITLDDLRSTEVGDSFVLNSRRWQRVDTGLDLDPAFEVAGHPGWRMTLAELAPSLDSIGDVRRFSPIEVGSCHDLSGPVGYNIVILRKPTPARDHWDVYVWYPDPHNATYCTTLTTQFVERYCTRATLLPGGLPAANMAGFVSAISDQAATWARPYFQESLNTFFEDHGYAIDHDNMAAWMVDEGMTPNYRMRERQVQVRIGGTVTVEREHISEELLVPGIALDSVQHTVGWHMWLPFTIDSDRPRDTCVCAIFQSESGDSIRERASEWADENGDLPEGWVIEASRCDNCAPDEV